MIAWATVKGTQVAKQRSASWAGLDDAGTILVEKGQAETPGQPLGSRRLTPRLGTCPHSHAFSHTFISCRPSAVLGVRETSTTKMVVLAFQESTNWW